MRSRRDQVQAYLFEASRIVGGMMKGRPDSDDPPHRRFAIGVVVGLLFAVLITAGFGIYGLLRPGGSTQWKREGSIILVKETGARFLLMDGQLRPVLNYTSARLILQNENAVITVARKSLTGVPVGGPIGILDAPDNLPIASALHTGTWTVCARPPAEPNDPPRTTLIFTPAAAASSAGTGALLVSTPDKVLYLVWEGRRYRIPEPTAMTALGYDSTPPIAVNPAWLNSIPAGRDLAAPDIPGRGEDGPQLNGRPGVVGQIYEVSNAVVNTRQLYLLSKEGLQPLSRTAAALIMGDPETRRAYPNQKVDIIPVGADGLRNVPVVESATHVVGYPASPPMPVNAIGSDMPCVRHAMSGGGTTVTTTSLKEQDIAGAVTVPTKTATPSTVDEVVVPTGSGMFVQDRAAPGAVAGARYLVSEYGVKFPLPDDNTVGALGYGGVAPVDMPSQMLAMLPTGPVLSRDAALQGQVWGQ
ncbi:type VII secretion protein EccB [Catenuloplanes atrovinosus]|uniref:Type VII secretion protein EccB n=1 Tax=Catenuloplanes atrovinosus TaxID=137266 RepID=A0AAE3YLX4_9ACTN|nr:type VII secretion protein EccB [Catenuloplanes atrovinosus]MDR7274266.1 type VII secretion protein EccB [Catenuloplanes atrovinosus]